MWAFRQGGLKSEVQHLAPPVRFDDDQKIPTDASRRAHGAGGDEVAGDVPAEHRLGFAAQPIDAQPRVGAQWQW